MARSSAEVEYRPMAHETCGLLWIIILMTELGFPKDRDEFILIAK